MQAEIGPGLDCELRMTLASGSWMEIDRADGCSAQEIAQEIMDEIADMDEEEVLRVHPEFRPQIWHNER